MAPYGWGRSPRFELLESRRLLAVDLALLKDVNPAIGAAGYAPQDLVEMNGVAYYSATDGASGRELWRSDGTAEGTYMLKDIRPGSSSSTPRMLTPIDGTLYFTAFVNGFGTELWKSDGTAEGTVMVADAVQGSPGLFDLGESPVAPHFIRAGANIFFRIVANSTVTDLWKTDGTAEGTQLVKRIHEGPSGFTFADMAAVGDQLIFRAPTGKLWRSDGTAEGTVLVEPLAAELSSVMDVTSFDGFAYFSANDGVQNFELWKSDGTPEGTTLVCDLYAADGSFPQELTVFNGALYFTAYDGTGGFHLWKLAAGSSSPQLVKQALPNAGIQYVTAAGDALYFYYNGDVWRSTGESERTTPLAPTPSIPSGFAAIGSSVYFRMAVGLKEELWVTDGTPAGTQSVFAGLDPVSDLLPAAVPLAGASAFVGSQGQSGVELWTTQGTAESNSIVLDRFLPLNGNPRDLVKVGDVVYFSADSGLWKTDGTPDGTVQVKDLQMITQQISTPAPGYSVAYQGQLYFIARGASDFGYQLYKTDGTPEGTVRVKAINPTGNAFTLPGFTNSDDRLPHFTIAGDYLYFRADDGSSGLELWRTDGSEAGTIRLTDVTGAFTQSVFSTSPSSFSSHFSPWFSPVGGTLYFRGALSTPIGSPTIWKSDGTTAGTAPVTLPSALSLFTWMAALDGSLYFAARINTDYGMWRLDPGAAAPVLVKAFPSPGLISNTLEQAVHGGYLYFTRLDSVTEELWRTDGTTDGTVRLLAAPFGLTQSFSELTQVGDAVFFTRTTPVSQELWKTDGTVAGTMLVSPVAAARLTPLAGGLYFSGGVASSPRLYISDGTADGTLRAVPAGSPVFDSPPQVFIELNGRLIVAAADAQHGMELWAGDFDEFPPAPGDFDRDADVDGFDFLRWQRTFGATVVPPGSGADADASGRIDGDDLAIWHDNFGVSNEVAANLLAVEADGHPLAAAASSIDAAHAALYAVNQSYGEINARGEVRPLGRDRWRRGR